VGGLPVRIAIAKFEGEDWNDALRKGDDVQEMRDAICGAKLEGPRDDVALSVKEFMSLEFPRREYLLEPWLTTSSITMIHAKPGVGKSLLAMSIGFAVASGTSLMKWGGGRKAKVLYVDGELPGQLLQKRLGWFNDVPDANIMVINRDRVTKVQQAPLDLAKEEDRALLDKIIVDNDIDLIILDSILTLFSSDTQKDFAPWIDVQNWAYGHRDAGRSIIYIHHETKSGKQFGTIGREIPLDVTIQLERDKKLKAEDDESVFRLSFVKHRDVFGVDTAPMMLDDGWKQVDIATELGVTESRVSQIVKKLRAEIEAENL